MATKPKDGIFIHISRGPEDPHRVLMALTLAEKMAEDKDVFVFFDIKGAEVPLKTAPSLEFKDFDSSSVLLSRLLEKGVQISVCPMCLKATNHQPNNLLDKVTLAEKEAFFDFTQGRILSLSY